MSSNNFVCGVLNMPTKQQLSMFIDTFLKLSRFEAEHRSLRGWGIYNEDLEQLPIPEVMVVLNWLHQIKEITKEEKEEKNKNETISNSNNTPYSLMCLKCRDGRYPTSFEYCVCST